MKTHSLLAVAIALGLSSAAHGQQELYTVGRFNRIFQINDYQTSTPTVTEITTWSYAGAFVGEATGLDIDPATGDFLLVVSPLFDPDVMQTDIITVDSITGIGSLIMSLPSREFSGFDRRWDGKLYTLRDGQELWLLDLETQTWTVESLSQSVGQFRPSLAVDENGQVVSLPSGEASVVDPISASITPSALPAAPIGGYFGNEYDSDGSFYLATPTAQILRYDPISDNWSTILDAFAQVNFAFDLAFLQTVDGVGYNETCTGQPNSTGLSSTLELLGSSDTASNNLELISRNLPPATFGFYILSEQTASQPVGSGVLCLGSPVFRYSANVLTADQGGTVRFPLDLTQLAGGQVALPGDTYHFQYWHLSLIHI